jgi:hypothetical protein
MALTFDQLKQQLEQAGLNTSAFQAEFQRVQQTAGDVNQLLRTMQTTLNGVQATSQDITSTFTDLSQQLKANLAELGRTNSALSVSKSAYKGITSQVDKLKNEEQGIYSLNVKQLKSLQEKARVNFDDLRRNVQNLSAEERRTEAGQAMLQAKIAGYAIEKEALAAIGLRLELEKKVEKTFGATGALIEGSSKLLSSMGFGHLSSELSDLNDKLKTELREELQKSGGEINKLALGFKYMGKGLAGSAKIFADGLTDPLFIVGKIFDTYLEINKASVDAQRLTGQNAVTAAGWNTSLASAKDYLETISELTTQTGRNAQNVFSKDVLSGAAELKVTMGLAADEAGGIAMMAQTSGRSVNNITKSVVATTSAFNKANRSAVSQGVVLKEVAKASDSIKLSLANNPEALAKAASAATKLGMSLQDVDNIASSLLNFEDSISNELEAELLIGKDLNLEKARELALSNDLAGLGEELFKNSADIAEFGKMNRIQQEAQAKALGMTRDQLAKVAYQRALDANMTEEQAAAAAGVNAEDMKRISAQENFAKALEKIAGAVAPILDVIGSILSIPLAPYLLIGIALSGKMLKNFSGIFDSIKGIAGGAKDMATGLLKGNVAETVAGKGGAAGGIGEKIAGAADKTKALGKEAGSGVKTFLINLGEGLKGLGQAVKTPYFWLGIAGIGALGAALIPLGYALKVAAPGIEAFGKVVSAAFAGLAVVVTAIADGFVKLMGAVTMENIGPMLLLGPALFGIAAGLGALSLAGFMAIPAIAGLVTLAAVAPALTTLATAVSGATGGSVGESKTKAEEGSLAAVEAKLAELITVVKAGGTVYLDSNKVGRTQVLGSYKSA